MNYYADIKTFSERCETHPDHQQGMVTEQMLRDRLYEEIDELRAYILHDAIIFTDGGKWVGLTDEEINSIVFPESGTATMRDFVRIIEAKLKEENT
jgi:hypothetical protein